MARSGRTELVVLLLNWRMAAATLQCLEDLRACPSDDVDLHTLLLDNGSGPEEEAMLAAAAEADSQTSFLPFGQNLGYCAAMNRGVAWAVERGVSYVLFLNNDMRLPADLLAPLVRVLDHDAGLAAVGPTILRPDGRVWCQGGRESFHPNLSRLMGLGREPAAVTSGPEAMDYLPGACALYRLEALQEVGGLDESYFMYFEDLALGRALRRAGRKILWLPWVRVTHAASSSSGGGRSPMRKYMTAVNSLRFLRQHGGLKLWAAFLLFDCLALPLAYLSGGLRAGWAKTRGVLDGLRGHRLCAKDVERWIEG